MEFFTDVSSRSGKVYVRYVKNGQRRKEVIEFEPEIYIKSNKHKDMVSMHDESLERLTFSTVKEMKDFINNYKEIDGFSVYGSDNIINQFITRNYSGNIDFDSRYINQVKLDIEVFSGYFDQDGNFHDGPFPDPETADYPVSAITLHDKRTDTYYTFGLEWIGDHYIGTYVHDKNHPRIGKLKVVYKGYREEHNLLADYVALWASLDIDVYSGFNVEGFDNPYLTKRIERVLGESFKKKLSPWGIVITDSIKNDWGGENTCYEYMGISMLDYLALFKKHAYKNPENYKLNTVAELVLGEGKIDYHEDAANPNELYARNFQKYIEYNIVDVSVLNEMDKKLQFIDLTFVLAYMTKSNYQDTLGTVKPWSALAYSMLYERGVAPKIKSIYQGNTQFAGGFVRAVGKPGKYRWIVSCDLNSLN